MSETLALTVHIPHGDSEALSQLEKAKGYLKPHYLEREEISGQERRFVFNEESAYRLFLSALSYAMKHNLGVVILDSEGHRCLWRGK